jgi:rhodanese-related sulfurtransferase
MRQKSSAIGILVLFMAIAGWHLHASCEEAQIISVQEVKAMVDSGEEITLLNPLSDILFNEGNIPGSVNIPLGEIPDSGKLPKNRDKLIVSYCSGPKSLVSKDAAALLSDRGFRNVKWLKEGVAGWVLAGYTLEHKNALPKIPVPGLDATQLRGSLEAVFVLDIRPPEQYEVGWIKGSRRLPIDDLSRRYADLPKGSRIVVVDQSGSQVIVAARFLQEKGYDVHALQGGMLSWVENGYPIEKQPPQLTSRPDSRFEN